MSGPPLAERRAVFSDPAVDGMMGVLLNLAQQVWAQEERLRALEGSGAGASEADREAAAFVARIFAPLREGSRPVPPSR